MRLAGLAMLAACTGGKTPPLDDAAARFIDVTCTSTCHAGTETQCRFTMETQFANDEPLLDDTGRQHCARCLVVRTQLQPALVAAGCNPGTDILMQELAVCDIDPMFDWDGDGDPTDDLTEACAGF